MSITIFEQDTFWTYYFLNLTCTTMILIVSVVYFVSRKEKKRNIYVSIGSFLLAVSFAGLLVVPQTLDIEQYVLGEYSIEEGYLNNVSIKKNGDSHETVFIVNDNRFEAKANLYEMRDFLGYYFQVHYLENSKHVVKIELMIKGKE